MNPLINDLVKSRHSCRKTILLVFFIFHPLASCADNEPTVIPGTIITVSYTHLDVYKRQGPPPLAPPATLPWSCAVSCDLQSMSLQEEQISSNDDGIVFSGFSYMDDNGNISSMEISDIENLE